MNFREIALSLAIIASFSCARVDPPDPDADTSPDGDADADADADQREDSGRDADRDIEIDGDSDPFVDDVIIYAHSRDTLYAFSPSQNEVISEVLLTVPDGSPAPLMVDLAVNHDGEVYTSGFEKLYQVNPESGVATPVGDLRDEDGNLLGSDLSVHLYALTFIPRSLYPDASAEEVLIGAANEGTCYEVDPTTARARYIGRYPTPWRSSGDLVAVEGLETVFATLREEESEDTDPDYLAQVTFLTGGEIALSMPHPVQEGDNPFNKIFGLGYWGRGLFGFTDAGELIEINRSSAAAQLATDDTGAVEFWGAGVTTQVPVLY